jgi:hypothetical protein
MADAPEAAKPQSIIPTIEILETDLRCIESSFTQHGNSVRVSTPVHGLGGQCVQMKTEGAYEGKTRMARKKLPTSCLQHCAQKDALSRRMTLLKDN